MGMTIEQFVNMIGNDKIDQLYVEDDKGNGCTALGNVVFDEVKFYNWPSGPDLTFIVKADEHKFVEKKSADGHIERCYVE